MATSSFGKIIKLDNKGADKIIHAMESKESVPFGGKVDKVQNVDFDKLNKIMKRG